jgi:tripartite ATP-independent transporter DctM subunit
MEWYWAMALLVGGALGLMFLSVPVALAFLGANLVGAVIFFGGQAGLAQVAQNMVEALATYSLAPVIMFVLMGEILFQTGVAVRAIDAVEKLIANVPGRLALVAVAGGTVFATLSGSSMANTALLGSTIMPEMRKRGYHRDLAMGPIMGTGGIAMLIPPSGMAVLLGSLSGISIGGILIGGAVPGLLIALVYATFIVARCTLSPHIAPRYDIDIPPLRARVRPFLTRVVPLFSLFLLVIGSIVFGWATPTESAALGALGSVAVCAAYRELSWTALLRALKATGRVAVPIFFIVGASLTFSQILSFSGATNGLLQMVRDLDPSPSELLFLMMGVTLFLGCLMDPVSIMLITLPFFLPLVALAQFDPIWFGVLMLLCLEISQTTPPFGMILFVMKGIAPPDTKMQHIYRAVVPFTLMEIAVLVFLMLVPGLVTWLPAAMNAG